MGKAAIGLRFTVLVSAGALALAACGGGSSSSKSGNGGSASPAKGGTLTIWTQEANLAHLDPQRNYTGEDLAFETAYLTRTLTAFKLSPGQDSSQLVGDAATDTGKSSNGGKTWQFTLRDGLKFEDGTPVTCADFKYGISRTFAQDVITDGPTYAISLLDIPQDKTGASIYKGPYKSDAAGQAAFDKAVTCSSDNKTITFNLNQPVGDFNYTVTLTSFGAVPKAKDTGEKYDDHPISDGPYKIQEYTKGQQLVLVRNDQWQASSDTYRKAYPDQITMKFGLDPAVETQRMQADAPGDQTAIDQDSIEPASLAAVFNDPRFANRRVNAYDPYVRYIAINTKKVPNLKQREAIAAALDRSQIITVNGGSYAGDIADGVIKPNLPLDYAPSGMWDSLLGQKIPDNGDPNYAKQLIQQSGAPMPALKYDYSQTPTHDKEAAAIVTSLAKAGIKVTPNPIPPGQYYPTVQNPAKANELMYGGWGYDWPNGSTIIPDLFTMGGGFDLSLIDDKAYNAKVAAAKAELDRKKQGDMWKELNKEAMQQVWVVPTRFGKTQRMAGSKVHAASGQNGNVYIWAPYGSWPYADLYVSK